MSTKNMGAQTSAQNEVLSVALGLVNRVPSLSTRPITHNIVVRLKGKTMLQVAKTSFDITVVKTIPANNEGEGVLAVDARRLSDFSSALGKGNVGLRLFGSNLTLWNASASAEFKGVGDEDFPRLDIPKGCPMIKIAPAHLKAAIQQVAFAAATDTARLSLVAVNWHLSNKQLTLAATDGIRLSESKAPLIDPLTEAKTILVPLNAMKVIESALGDGDAAEIALCEGRIAVTCGNTIVHAQLLAERFIDYAPFIPKVACSTQMPREAFVRTLKSVGIFHDYVDIRLGDKRADIGAVGAEVGSGRGIVVVESFKGDPQTFRAQARLIWQPLEVVDTASFVIGGGGPNKAILMKPKGEQGPVSSLHVVMPYVSPSSKDQAIATQSQPEAIAETVA